jgi:hypothetical protein
MLTLGETTDVVLKWVNSIETKEQLDLIKEVVETFIVRRFSSESERDRYNARYKLDLAIYEKEASILFP